MASVERGDRLAMLDKQVRLSIRRQSELLNINRSSYYRPTQGEKVDNIVIMNEIDQLWHQYPFYGYRRMTAQLRRQGYDVNGKRILRLMHKMEIQALYPKPHLSKGCQADKKYPYLLKESIITSPNNAWQVDITYLKLKSGFMYLIAIIDVYSRYIVSWRLSNSMQVSFCIEALEWALQKTVPDIINTDQGSQFTCEEWTQLLSQNQISISMTSRGRCLDNIYIERFWRSLKYEEIFLHDYQDVPSLKAGINTYIKFYNHERLHQSLDYQTPEEYYFSQGNDQDEHQLNHHDQTHHQLSNLRSVYVS